MVIRFRGEGQKGKKCLNPAGIQYCILFQIHATEKWFLILEEVMSNFITIQLCEIILISLSWHLRK